MKYIKGEGSAKVDDFFKKNSNKLEIKVTADAISGTTPGSVEEVRKFISNFNGLL